MFFSVLSITLVNCEITFLAINPGSGFKDENFALHTVSYHQKIEIGDRENQTCSVFLPQIFKQTYLCSPLLLLNGEYLDALMENVRQQISFLYSCFPAMLGDIAVTVANYRWTIKRSCFQMKYQSVQNLLRSMYHEKMRMKNMIFIQNTPLFKRIMTICHVILKVESSC